MQQMMKLTKQQMMNDRTSLDGDRFFCALQLQMNGKSPVQQVDQRSDDANEWENSRPAGGSAVRWCK